MGNMELPREITEDILLRLPVKTLMRFKCVSKCWNALLNDPSFPRSYKSRHNGRINVTTGYFYHRPCYPQRLSSTSLAVDVGPAKFMYTSMDCADREEIKSLDYLHEFGYVLASSKGLLLLSRNPMSYYVYDLVSKKHVKIPRNLNKCHLPPREYFVSVGFMCSDNEQQLLSYKVVHVEFEFGSKTTRNVQTYSSETGKWRQSIMKGNFPFNLDPDEVAKVIGGSFHWYELGNTRLVAYNPEDPEGQAKLIEMPRVANYGMSTYEGTNDGSLQFVHVTNTIDLWVMTKRGVSYLDGDEAVINRSNWKLMKKVSLSKLGIGRWDFGPERSTRYPCIIGIDPANKCNIYLTFANKIYSYNQEEDKIEDMITQKLEFDAYVFAYFEWPVWPCL